MSVSQKVDNLNVIFNELLSEIQFPLFKFIFSLIPHKEDSEDVLQKTNLILCKKQNEFDPKKGSFKGWAFRIARFQVLAHQTRNRRSKVFFSNELTETLAEEFVDHETPIIQHNALNKCYQKLPNHMRVIAELRFKREFTYKEISLSTNRPVSSISATLSRVREYLSKCIQSAYKEAEEEFHNQ